MQRKLPPLNALRAFEAAARHMSFTDAAEELCVTQGAISRQIKSLEQRLGLFLFKRMTRRLELTEEGEVLFPSTRHAFDDIERAFQNILGRGDATVLTVSALPTFAMNWLTPRLPDFNEHYPDIEVQLMMTIRAVNFARDNIDVAIRVGNPGEPKSDSKAPRIGLTMTEDWNGVISMRLLSDQLVPVAAPAVLKRGKKIASPDELHNYTLLHVGSRAHAWPDWLEALGANATDLHAGPVFGHFIQSLLAAKKGQGIALIPHVLVEQEIKNGELVIAYQSDVRSDGDYYLLYRSKHESLPKIKAFREWIKLACGGE